MSPPTRPNGSGPDGDGPRALIKNISEDKDVDDDEDRQLEDVHWVAQPGGCRERHRG